MICPKCNTVNSNNEKFCKSCGFQLNSSRICPECNSVNNTDSKFCQKCGASLSPVNSFKKDIIEENTATSFLSTYKIPLICGLILVLAIGAAAGMGLFGGDGGSDSWLPISSNSSYADTQFQDSVIPDDSTDNLNDNQTLNKTENKSAELENKTNSNNITKNTTKDNNTNSSKYFVKNTTDKVKNITKDSGKNSSQNTVKDTNKNKNATKSVDKSKTTSSSKSSQDKSEKTDKSEKSPLKSNNQSSSIIIKTNDNDLDDLDEDLDDNNGLDDLDEDDEDNDNDDGLDDDANDADKDEDSLSSSNALKMTDVPNLAKEASDRNYNFNSISYNGNQLTKAQCMDIFSKYILNIDSHSDSDIEIRDIDDASSPSGEDSSQSISKSDYLSIANRVSSWIDKNNQVPNYVGVSTMGQADLSPDKMLELFGQVILEYSITEELPSSVEI